MYKSERLFDEFVQIERNINTGKVDHPQNGHKDVLDAVCGSVFTASKYAEQYAFDYGEMLDTITEVSKSTSQEYQIKEMNKQFEEQLSNQLNPLKNLDKETLSENDQSRLYLSQGIVIF